MNEIIDSVVLGRTDGLTINAIARAVVEGLTDDLSKDEKEATIHLLIEELQKLV